MSREAQVRFCESRAVRSRPATHLVLLVSGGPHHAEALRAEVAAVIAPLGLRLAEEKIRVVHIDEGFDFLGFHIRRMQKRGTQKRYVYTTPSRKSVQKVRDGIREQTYRSTLHMDLDELIVSLNRSVRGWANHFRYGVSKAVFDAVDHHMWWRVAGWIRRKHNINRAQLRRRFCDRGWRIAAPGTARNSAIMACFRPGSGTSAGPPRSCWAACSPIERSGRPRHRHPPPNSSQSPFEIVGSVSHLHRSVGSPIVQPPEDRRGRLAGNKLLGGAVSVVDEEHATTRSQAIGDQRPERREPLERHVRQPEAEKYHVVATIRLPVKDVRFDKVHAFAVDSGRSDAEHFR
jgi:hypothetical protein